MIAVPTEHAEQAHVMMWASIESRRHKELEMLFAVPNGGKRNLITGAIMKREGQKKGVPDLVLPIANTFYHGLFIEMKRKKGGTITKEQKEWIERLSDCGYCAQVCFGADAAIAVIKNYLGIN